MVKKTEKVLTEMEERFLDALFGEDAQGNPVTAKELAGYAQSTTAHSIMKQLSEEIRERAKQVLANYSGKAAWTLINMLGGNSTDAGAANKIKAAQEILNRAAVKEQEPDSSTINVPTTGLVILPAKAITIEQPDNDHDDSDT